MNAQTRLADLLIGKQLLIFDFDGTLADTSALHAAAFSYVLSPLGISVDYSEIAGLNTADALSRCLATAGQVVPHSALAEMVAAKQRKVRESIACSLGAFPWVGPFLQWAKPRYRLSLATSGSRDTVTIALKKLGFLNLFDPIVCSEDVRHSKPDPEIYLTVLRLTEVPASAALVFEDSAAGFASAAAAGLHTVDVAKLHVSSTENRP